VNLLQEIEDLAMLLSVEDHFGKSESAAWTRRTFTTLLAFGGGPESETSLQLEDLVWNLASSMLLQANTSLIAISSLWISFVTHLKIVLESSCSLELACSPWGVNRSILLLAT
jgi:hypothetical protein